MNTFAKTISKYFGVFKKVPFLPHLIDQQLKIYSLFFRPKVFISVMEFNNWIRNLELINVGYHKYGGLEYSLKGMEICHLHSDGLVDIKSSKLIKEKFEKFNNVEPHHKYPSSNMLSVQLESNSELELVKKIVLEVYKHKIAV